MAALLRLIRLAAEAEMSQWRDHARRRAGLLLALAVCGGVALLLALVLAVVGLALWLGPIAGLGAALGIAILLCLVLLIALQMEARAHARRAEARAAERRRLVEAGLLTVLPGLRAGSALVVGLAVLALVLLTGPRKDD